MRENGRVSSFMSTSRNSDQSPYRRYDGSGKRRYRLGYAFVDAAIDDHSRVAYAEIFGDEKATPPSDSSTGPSPGSHSKGSPLRRS